MAYLLHKEQHDFKKEGRSLIMQFMFDFLISLEKQIKRKMSTVSGLQGSYANRFFVEWNHFFSSR